MNLDQAEAAVEALEAAYEGLIVQNNDLNRKLVSYQNSKRLPVSRWFKYKEGFSSELVEYCLNSTKVDAGTVLDPFAGSGTTLFTANRLGLASVGVEILPIAQEIIQIQEIALSSSSNELAKGVRSFLTSQPWISHKVVGDHQVLNEVSITKGAYSPENKAALERYLRVIGNEDTALSRILRFAALCILESISFTRKDGQFLRWDQRSGRSRGKSGAGFDKGKIWDFEEAIQAKLTEIADDLESLSFLPEKDHVTLVKGSILRESKQIPSDSISGVVTSPPYLNRYDYTRTYALELAFLGLTDDEIKGLRQELLSATVENREKDLANTDEAFKIAKQTLDGITAYKACRDYLFDLVEKRELNNPGIARMFEGYFIELSATLVHVSRMMQKDAPFVMVNDNVRYGGLAIPVDLILSEVAKNLGLATEVIWVLPGKKGNSSQQMGVHGRLPLRKCVYVWRKL